MASMLCVLADKGGKAAVAKKSPSGPASKLKEDRGKDVKPTNSKKHTKEASSEEISEFFGEAKKSSTRQFQADSEDDSELEVTKEGGYSDSADDSDNMESVRNDATKNAEFILEEVIEKRLRYAT